MQNKRKNHTKKKSGKLMISLGIILLVFILLFTNMFEPTLSGICDYKSRIFAYDIINDSIDAELLDEELKCEDFLEFLYDDSGKIIAVNANLIFANEVVGKVAAGIRKRYEFNEIQSYKIHIGDLFGYSYLYSKGFEIPISVEPQGWIETNVLTDFCQNGINSTTVKVILEVKMTTTSQLAVYSKATQISVSVPIAQTTVLGEIPSYIGSGVIAGSVN